MIKDETLVSSFLYNTMIIILIDVSFLLLQEGLATVFEEAIRVVLFPPSREEQTKAAAPSGKKENTNSGGLFGKLFGKKKEGKK